MAQNVTLTVNEIGQGTVTSADGQINCVNGGGSCTGSYPAGTLVTLNNSPANSWVFSAWSNCNGRFSCTVIMSQSLTVTATFIQCTNGCAQVSDFHGYAFSQSASATPVDSVSATAPLSGQFQWGLGIADNSSSTLTSPSIAVTTGLPASSFQGAVAPTGVSAPSLSPNGQLQFGFSLANPVSFTAGFDSSRSVSPFQVPAGVSTQTMVLTVTARDSRYFNPANNPTSIGVSFGDSGPGPNSPPNVQFVNLVSISWSASPPSTGVESLQNGGTNTWFLNNPVLNTTYTFTLVYQVNNQHSFPVNGKTGVNLGMTVPYPSANENCASTVTIPDSPLDGTVTYSASPVLCGTGMITQDNYGVQYLSLSTAYPQVPRLNQPVSPFTQPPNGPNFGLNATGTGFDSDAQLVWNGISLPTSVISSTKLSASVPGSMTNNPGSAAIQVRQSSNNPSAPFTSNIQEIQLTRPEALVYSSQTLPAGTAPQRLLADNFIFAGPASFLRHLAVTNTGSNSVSVYIGDGHGNLSSKGPFSTGAGPVGIAAGDFNGDGNLDLVTANSADGTITVLLGDGNGNFTRVSPDLAVPGNAGPVSIVADDFNQDGNLDLAVVNQLNNTIQIFLGNGDGTFAALSTQATGNNPNALVSGDFNGDGKIDLAVANQADHTISIFLGNGDGTFQSGTTYSTSSVPHSIVAADLNGDGQLDLVVSTDSGALVFTGNGNGTFQAPTLYATTSPAYGVAVGDLNGDGWLDLAVSNGAQVSVFLGAGGGSFDSTPDANLAAGGDAQGIAALNLNQDGRLDLAVVSNAGNSVTLLISTIAISPTSLTSGPLNQGTFYNFNLAASGGTNPYNFSVVSGGLPPGMNLSSSGTLSGSPSQPGTYNFTIQATSALGFSGTQAYSLVVTVVPITLTPNTLPSATVGLNYGQPIQASGGVGPYTFSVTSGALPPGLTLSPPGINGRPTAPGNFNFVLTALDSVGNTGSQPYVIQVNPGTITVSPPQSTSSPLGSTLSPCVQFNDPNGGSDSITIDYGDGTGAQPFPGIVNIPGFCGTPPSPQPSGTNGQFNLSHVYTHAGAFTVTITVTDTTYGVAGVAHMTVTVTPAFPNMGLNGTPQPSTYGQNVTFTATVTTNISGAPAPTGTVSFLIDGTPAATDNLVGGAAIFSIGTLTVGSHTILANYSGDANFSANSRQFTQNVNPGVPTVTLTATPSTVTFGSAVTLQVNVSSLLASPTGTIQFFDVTSGQNLLLTLQPIPVTLTDATDSSVTFTTTGFSNGTHTVRVNYSGAPNLNGGTATTVVTVNAPAPPTFSQILAMPAGACICTPIMRNIDSTGSQAWFVTAGGSSLTLTVYAYAINSTDPETVQARFIDQATNTAIGNPIIAQYPAATPQNTVVSASGTFTTTPGAIYRVGVSTPSTPQTQAFYWLQFQGASEAGMPSPSLNTISSVSIKTSTTQWLFNLDANEQLAVNFFPPSFVTLAPPTAATSVNIQVFDTADLSTPVLLIDPNDPSGQTTTTTATLNNPNGVNATIQIATAPTTPKIYAFFVEQPNGDYRLAKQTGSDTGIYASWATSGIGTITGNISVGSLPLTSLQATVSGPPGGDNPTVTLPAGTFTIPNVPVGHYSVQLTAPAGYIVTPSVVTFDVTCAGTTTLTTVQVTATPPVVTTSGNVTVSATGPSGAAATFTATATDVFDGTDPVICLPASGSTFPFGTTTVACTATDSVGSIGSATLTVTVLDTAPSFTAPANQTVSATSTAGTVATYATPIATDLKDGTDAVTCTPASGSTFPIATTTVTCSATNSSGMTTTHTFAITILDTAPSFIAPANQTLTATSAAGAVATYTTPTATDLKDGTDSVTCTPASGSTFPVGMTTVTCSATNSSSMTTIHTFTITVLKAAATLTLGNLTQTFDGTPKSVTVTTNPVALTGVTVTYNGSTTPPTNAGSYSVVASLSNPAYTAPNATGTLIINPAAAAISLSNLAQAYDGTAKTVTATITPAICGPASITYNGSSTAPTNVGSYAVVASSANPNCAGPSATGTLIIFAYASGGGTFVVGDLSAAAGGSQTFWGSQWAKKNSLSGGGAPNSFKGFADQTSPAPPSCGGTWTSGTGNSSGPPATVPAFMAVVVSSSITQSGSVINGNIKQVVIVQTDSGYASDPGHAGTGTIVATVCRVN